ncbi:peptidoglycan binding protein CsiV [Pseudomonas solani]|uniref:peptidoglycan binding protein CsiV n=1 Tax=Pseudomonas TaxID=286 RepID=UPI0021E0C7B6|nr:peptidoglycan binding protein CsiV [Pseudomonas sp. PDM13]MCU9950034.1 peptidoglycan binding protein CsiV [Pseudomonas sp. PDM13]
MRAFRFLALMLALLAPSAFADGLYQVELILFRQSGEATPASQPAPDDWANGAQGLDSVGERATALNGEAAKLNAGNGYQVLLHKAWSQSVGANPSRVAISTGDQQLGHFPVEGTVTLSQVRYTDVAVDFWVNQFDGSGLLSGSERIKQGTRLKNGELTYLDHSSLGVLIRISPL